MPSLKKGCEVLKVYVDARCLQDNNYKNRGVGRHTKSIVKYSRSYLPPKTELIGLVDDHNLPHLGEASTALFDKISNSFGEAASKANIFLNPFVFLSNQNRALGVLAKKDIFSACLFYDLIPLLNRDKYLSNTDDYLEYLTNLNKLQLYNQIVSISQSSESDLKSTISLKSTNLVISGVGISSAFSENKTVRLFKQKTKQNFDNPYFIMVGGADNRKNMMVALKAFAQLSTHNYEKASFSLVGDFTKEQIVIYRETSKSLGFSQRLFIYSGLTDSDLSFLYTNAVANICPSFAEGFFLPIIEGIACGAPPIASNIPAQNELLNNDKEILFQADDISRLTDIMVKMLSNRIWRSKVLLRHLHLVTKFSETEVAKRTWASIYSSYKSSNASTSFIKSQKHLIKPKLAFITPYPPDNSGCARYSQATIQNLSKYARVDVFTDATEIQSNNSVENFYNISALAHLSKKYDSVISVIGNSHYHSKIFDLVLEYGGVVIEHDNRLLDFYNWKFGSEYTASVASREIGNSYNQDDIYNWLHHSENIRTLFLNDLYDSSTLLFMHSKPLINHYHQISGRKASYLPFCIYSELSPNQRMNNKKRARTTLGVSDDEILIISLGSVDPTKYCNEIVMALNLLNSTTVKYKFYFVGHCSSNQFRILSDLIKNNKNIIIEEEKYYSKKEYNLFLNAADLGIQLRRHKFGGLSGGLMDSISVGLPTIANKDLASSMDSPAYVQAINDDPSPEAILNSFLTFTKTEYTHAHIMRGYNKFVSNHNFDLYSSQLLEHLKLK